MSKSASVGSSQFLKRWLTNVGVYGVITLVSVTVAFGGFEIYARLQLVRQYSESSRGLPLIIQNQPLSIAEIDTLFNRKVRIDPKGFYFKVNETFATGLVATSGYIQEYVVRTNSLGFLSDKQYRMEPYPASPEYRIAVLGDSMTGMTTVTRQWVDTLEDLLNESVVLRKAVGGKTFKTINLGWPGAGFEVFQKAHYEKARKFMPDMVVVNFIENDFPRTAAGAHIVDMDEAVATADRSLREIAADHPNLIVTFMPGYGDMFPEPPLRTPVLTERLRALTVPIAIVDTRIFLPIQVGSEKAKSWYNFPSDSHMSDLGGELYARAMAAVISERLTGTRIDFGEVPSRFFLPEVTVQPAEGGRTYTLKILNQPEKLKAIRRTISSRSLKAKLFRTAHLYSLDKLRGMGQNVFQIPPGFPV